MTLDYTDQELEVMASAHLLRLRHLVKSYALLYGEGIRRGLSSFHATDLTLLKEDECAFVAEHLKDLPADQLIDCVYRYKDMPTCFRLTLEEIQRRL